VDGRRTVWRGVAKFALGVLLFVALAQAGTVALAWWRGEIARLGAGDALWLLSLPVLVGVYLRWFSVLRPDCTACAPDDRTRPGGPAGP
jgi:hypothetical protein